MKTFSISRITEENVLRLARLPSHAVGFYFLPRRRWNKFLVEFFCLIGSDLATSSSIGSHVTMLFKESPECWIDAIMLDIDDRWWSTEQKCSELLIIFLHVHVFFQHGSLAGCHQTHLLLLQCFWLRFADFARCQEVDWRDYHCRGKLSEKLMTAVLSSFWYCGFSSTYKIQFSQLLWGRLQKWS